MITTINNLEDVKTFFIQLVDEGTNAHPDDEFGDYVNNDTGEQTYNSEQAEFRNALMQVSFEICDKSGIDIYDLMQEVYLIETGLDKYIPLPSSGQPSD